MKKILIINGNPKTESFCKALAETYYDAAKAKHEVKFVQVGELHFEMSLQEGYSQDAPLEPDLSAFQKSVTWADHIVVIAPVWWGVMPAKLKALFDRTLLPGFAFQYLKGKAIPKKLLAGRTAELIITLDTPVWWYKFVQGQPLYKTLKHATLDFVGIRVIKKDYLGPVISSTESQREAWLLKVRSKASNV